MRFAGKLDSATMEFGAFTEQMRSLTQAINLQLWDLTIKFIWMNQHFVYNGKRRRNLFANSPWTERAYSHFMREMIGTPLFIFTRGGVLFKVCSYLDELFPEFLEHNPFEEPEYYAFPYDTVTLDYMYFVYQVPERMDLLEIAEERGLNYNEFVDYVVNHALSTNDEVGRKVFRLKQLDSPYGVPHIWHEGWNPWRSRFIRVPNKFKNAKHG